MQRIRPRKESFLFCRDLIGPPKKICYGSMQDMFTDQSISLLQGYTGRRCIDLTMAVSCSSKVCSIFMYYVLELIRCKIGD